MEAPPRTAVLLGPLPAGAGLRSLCLRWPALPDISSAALGHPGALSLGSLPCLGGAETAPSPDRQAGGRGE